jgi:hypothetical protein
LDLLDFAHCCWIRMTAPMLSQDSSARESPQTDSVLCEAWAGLLFQMED